MELESLFIKEFKDCISKNYKVRDIFKVPLPEESNSWYKSNGELLAIKGIKDEVYSQLNGTLVKRIPRGSKLYKRKVDLVNRAFKVDESGNFIKEEVRVPSGSLAVLSDRNLSVPYKYKPSEEGFTYIDFIQIKGKRYYIYTVPKVYLYETNQTALVLSVKNMKNYSGKGYYFWNFGLLYLHIIPYKHTSKYVGSKVLKTGLKLNYSDEIKSLLGFWMSNNLIPNIFLCETSEGNLATHSTVTGYDLYNPIEELSIFEKGVYSTETL